MNEKHARQNLLEKLVEIEELLLSLLGAVRDFKIYLRHCKPLGSSEKSDSTDPDVN